MHYFNDTDTAAHAITAATMKGTLPDAVSTILATRRSDLQQTAIALLTNTVDTLLQKGCDATAVSYKDPRALAFMLKGSAMRTLELRTAAADELVWRMQAVIDLIQHYRSRIGSIKLIAIKTQDDTPSLRITAMPERITSQTVERDADNEITATHTTERDA